VTANLATLMRRRFVKRKISLLRAVANEQKTPGETIAKLEKLYVKQTAEFLRSSRDTTYSDWLEHGPLGELDEVRAARRDEAVWDRLLDKARGDL
jgi:hypothetical protein